MIISNIAECVHTVGVELECIVLDSATGDPVDVKTILQEEYGGSCNVIKNGVIMPEVGPYQVELITEPQFQGLLTLAPLERLTKAFLQCVAPGSTLLYRSFWDPVHADLDALLTHPFTSPQHVAKLRALAEEAGHDGIALWSVICSTHVHIGVAEGYTLSQCSLYRKGNLWAGLLLRNFLNLCAPYMARRLTPEDEQENLSERFEVLLTSVAPSRVPRYAWLADEEEFATYIRSMGPRLYSHNQCSGEWEVDLVTQGHYNDPVTRDSVFDLVRLSNKGTVELRVLPPMADPFSIARAAEAIQHISTRVLNHFHTPGVYRIEDVAPLFPALHADLPLYVPPELPSEEAWHALLRR